MKKSIALSATVLAAAFTFCPISKAEDQAQQAQQRAQQAGQQAQQAGQDAQQRGREGAAGIRGEARDAAAGARGEGREHNPDQMFVKEAAADNQFEIQLGQFVQQQAQNQQVKQLAQEMVQDHQQAQQQLQQIAQGMNMQLPSELEQWQQAKLQAMQQKHGEHLERAFTFGQVGAHHTDILKFQYEAQRGQNEQLKQFAQQTIPTLEKHMRMAEMAAEQWVPTARTAGEHMRGNKDNQRNDRDNLRNDPSGRNAGESGNLGGTNGTQSGGNTNTGTGTGGTGTGAGSTGGTNSGVNR
jgi:putative membrane protein